MCVQDLDSELQDSTLQLRDTLAGDYKASRHQFVPGPLDDLIRFTGKERFIDSCFSLQNNRVRRDLVAAL